MCDYSLENQASRSAQTGDRLVTSGFENATTRGFCAEGEPQVAVCLLPGTEIAFVRPVTYQGIRGLLCQAFNRQSKTARFRRINIDDPCAHHDALELDSGRIVLLDRLRPGQRASVLQLPANSARDMRHRHDQEVLEAAE